MGRQAIQKYSLKYRAAYGECGFIVRVIAQKRCGLLLEFVRGFSVSISSLEKYPKTSCGRK